MAPWTLNLSPGQSELVRPGFETFNLAIGDKIEDWNRVFLHVRDELKQKNVRIINGRLMET